MLVSEVVGAGSGARAASKGSTNSLPKIHYYCETCRKRRKRTPHELLSIVAMCLVCHDAVLMLVLEED